MPALTKYFNTYKTDAQGHIFLTGILDIQAYTQINLEIIQFPVTAPTLAVSCTMGVISGTTLAQTVASFPSTAPAQIHTFPVIGPEFSVVLTGGPPNTNVAIQAWLFSR
jgi:hypothetical protein